MPLGGMVPLVNIMLSEVIFGGVGAGMYGMLIYIVLAVFIAGLMVGRTPEYIGKKITAAEMQGGCFTISSLGGIGGTAFTPIINAPEVAILGMGRSTVKPVVRDGKILQRAMMPLVLSYDHRVNDGANAARFIVDLVKEFEGIADVDVKI